MQHMHTEVRTLSDADREAQVRIAAYSYTSTPAHIREYVQDIEAASDGTQLGIFADGELAAALVDWRFDLRVNDSFVPANGIGMVASAAESRRRGLVRSLIADLLARLRADGVVLSLLYPFDFRFYNRMGWGFGERRLQLKVAPKEFAAFGAQVGRVRELLYCEAGEFRFAEGHDLDSVTDILDAIYKVDSAGWDLAAIRTREDWRRHLHVRRGRRHIFAWYNEAGQPEGYMMAFWNADGWDAELRCRELRAVTPEALRGLCFFVGCHDSQTKHVQMMLPFEHNLLELFGNPRVEAKLEHGPMVRAVDVAGLLAARGTGSAGAGECVLSVRDELAPWNTGRYGLSGTGEQVTVSRIDDQAGEDADLRMEIDAFSQLACGCRSVDDLLAIGLVTGRTGAGLDYARRLFVPRRLWHNEYY